MIRFVTALGVLLGGISVGEAQSHRVYRYDTKVIDSSIKCELGRVAREFSKSSQARTPENSARMVAFITATGEEVISRKLSGGISSIFSATANYERKSGRIRSLSGKRNIHVDNSVNCRKSNIVDVGVYSCFDEQRDAFLAGQTISCKDTSFATSSANAGGKFSVWVIGAEVSGELANTRSWTIDIAAPPKKD